MNLTVCEDEGELRCKDYVEPNTGQRRGARPLQDSVLNYVCRATRTEVPSRKVWEKCSCSAKCFDNMISDNVKNIFSNS